MSDLNPDQIKKNSSISQVTMHNISFYENRSLLMDNVNCTIKSQGTTVVMGPNGAGKSLFLRLLAGLLKPASGQITGGFCGNGNQSFSNMLIIFQRPVMLRRTAAENISYVLGQQNFIKEKIGTMVTEALETARLLDCANRPAKKLSGGEQQRLALARALAVNPPALLLDEATANLDPASTHIFEAMVNQAAKNGTKIIFVTHDIRQAKRMADDILFIHKGKILSHMPARDFFNEPGSDQAQAYLDGRLAD